MAFFDQQQIDGITEFYDELIESFAVSCKLFYQNKFVEGANNLKLADSTYASNTGIHGGPMLGVQNGQGGTDLIAQESTEVINLVIDWSLRDSKLYGKTVTVPYSIIKTHGFLTDLVKIQRAIEMQVKLPNYPINIGRFKFLGEGEDVFSIIQGRYFIGYWERVS